MRGKELIVEEQLKLHYNRGHTIKELDIWDSRFINSCLVGENQRVVFSTGKIFTFTKKARYIYNP